MFLELGFVCVAGPSVPKLMSHAQFIGKFANKTSSSQNCLKQTPPSRLLPPLIVREGPAPASCGPLQPRFLGASPPPPRSPPVAQTCVAAQLLCRRRPYMRRRQDPRFRPELLSRASSSSPCCFSLSSGCCFFPSSHCCFSSSSCWWSSAVSRDSPLSPASPVPVLLLLLLLCTLFCCCWRRTEKGGCLIAEREHTHDVGRCFVSSSSDRATKGAHHMP